MNKKLKVLVIGAHQDDCELKTGGLAVLLRKNGHDVKYVSATNGDTGHHEIGGGQLARIRSEEFKKSCSITGIEAEILDIHNNGLESDIPTREKFITLIRKYNPDILITHRLNDYHPDHRRTSMLVQDSSYAIIIPNVCALTPVMSKAPVILYMQDNFKRPYEFVPDIVVGTDTVFDVKLQMVNCHKSQFYEWLPWASGKLDEVPESQEDRMKWLRNNIFERDNKVANLYRDTLILKFGEIEGNATKTAEAFEVSEYGSPASNELVKYLESLKA